MQVAQDEDASCLLTRNGHVEEEGSVVLSPRDNEPVVADGQAEAVLGVRLQGKSRIVNDLHVHSIAGNWLDESVRNLDIVGVCIKMNFDISFKKI